VAKAPEIVAKLVEAIITNAPKLLKAALEIIVKLCEGLTQNFFKLVNMGREFVSKIWSGLKEKIENAKNWGRDLIDNFIGGIKEKWENLKNSVSSIGSTIKNFIGFSEPKEGPLSDFHTYAPDMIDLFIKGLKEGQSRLAQAMAKTFDPADMVSGVADVTVGGAGGMAVTIPLNIDGQLLTKVIAQIQWAQGIASVRNYGGSLA